MATGSGTIKLERNLALYNDWKSGNFSCKELTEKYQITRQRIYRIVDWVKNYDNRPNH